MFMWRKVCAFLTSAAMLTTAVPTSVVWADSIEEQDAIVTEEIVDDSILNTIDKVVEQKTEENEQDVEGKSANVHRIRFDANGGYFIENGERISTVELNVANGKTIYDSYGMPEKPLTDDESVVFVGWYLEGGSETDLYTHHDDRFYYDPVESDLTFTAVWDTSCTITLDPNGGTIKDPVSYEYITSPGQYKITAAVGRRAWLVASIPEVYPPDGEAKTGLLGWSSDPDGMEMVTDSLYSYTPESDITLYAIYRPYITLTFHGNGGTIFEWNEENDVSSLDILQQTTYGFEYVSNNFTAEDKRLIGWAESPDGPVKYNCAEKAEFYQDTDLYAVWEDATPKKITFDANGGSFEDGQDEKTTYVEYDESIYPDDYVPSAPVIDDNNKVFGGWYCESDPDHIMRYSYEFPRHKYEDGDITYYANWIDAYIVTFDANGGYFGDSHEATKESWKFPAGVYPCYNHTEPEDPHTDEARKIFKGWYRDKECTDPIQSYEAYYQAPDGNVTFFAGWSDAITISFDAYGGYLATDDGNLTSINWQIPTGGEVFYNHYSLTDTIEHGTENPDKHLALEGWYTDRELTNRVEMSDIYALHPTEDTTFYAKYDEAYCVIIDPNGGTIDGLSGPKEISVLKGNSVQQHYSGVQEGDRYKSLYGWSLDPAGKEMLEDDRAYSKSNALFYFEPQEDTTIYAQYRYDYSLELNGNGGYFEYSPTYTSIYKGLWESEPVNLLDISHPANEDTHMVLVGAAYDAEGTDMIHDPEHFVPTEDVVLYLIWKPGYAITFDGIDVEIDTSFYKTQLTKAVLPGTAIGEISVPERVDNKVFKGWYADKDLTEAIPDIETVIPKKDTTFYAKYEILNVVFLDAQEGYFATPDETVYIATAKEGEPMSALPSDLPPHNDNPDRIFDGWYLDQDYKHPVESLRTFVPTDITHIYAKWADALRVTLNANGGKFVSLNTDTCEIRAKDGGNIPSDELRTPKKEGFHFTGWFEDPECTKAVKLNEYVVNEPVTIYAGWESPLQITTQPVDTAAEVGETVHFSISAQGEGLTYQWQYRQKGKTTWYNSGLEGRLTHTLTVPVTAARNGQSYRCIVTDKNGEHINSEAATLTTRTPLKITTQPKAAEGAAGETVSFTIKAEGTGLTYQWQYKPSGKKDWYKSGLEGNKTTTLKVPVTTARNGQAYRCIVTDSSGASLTSNEAVLLVTNTLVIKMQPQDATGIIGKTVTFMVAAQGNGLTYQWQYRGAGKTMWFNSGQTGSLTNALKVPVTAARNGQSYRCLVKDGSGASVTSNVAVLTAKEEEVEFAITKHPEDTSTEQGGTTTMSVTATGKGLTYQWQYQAAGSSEWKKSGIGGSKTAKITITGTMYRNGQKYRCIVTDQNGDSLTSNPGTLTVRPKSGIEITQQPVDVSGAVGSTVTISVKAEGTELTYQWQYCPAGKSDWYKSGLEGAKTATLKVPVKQSRDGQKYRCVITDVSGKTVTSQPAVLDVR